jgi:hypothetical protein
MSSTVPQGLPQQLGGMRPSVVDEATVMVGHFILVALVLISVYVSRIPPRVLSTMKNPIYQILGLLFIILLTVQYGWIHGIMASLAFALVLSRATRPVKEGLVDYIPLQAEAVVIEDPDSIYIPENHRWFSERLLGERPFIIRDKEVKTSAVQDLSERSMGSSAVTK